MAHSMGATGWAYASGVRATPGGSAFTLTGVFIDRITPRLLNVAATAKATAAAINGIAPSMRGQVALLQAQSTQVKLLAARYKDLGLAVGYYEARLQKAKVQAATMYPTHRKGAIYPRIGWRKAEAKQRAMLAPYVADLAAVNAERNMAADTLKSRVAQWKVERAITREKWKQVALAKESLRAGFGDMNWRVAGKRAGRVGALGGVVGLAGAGIGVIALAAIQSEYTKASAQVRAIGALSISEMGRLSEFVLNQTRLLAITAEDAMGGMLTLVRAGIRSAEEMRGLADPAMKLSVVNAINLEEALRNILVVQNAFNLERETGNEIAANQQILINQSLMDFSDYVDGMKYAIAWSNKLGLTYQQTAAAIATMTDAGIRAGIGGRGMRRMFSKFAQDLEIIEARLKQGGSNLTVFSEEGILNLSALLHELGESGDTVEDLEFALSTFGLRGSTAFLTLAQHADEFDEHVKSQTGDINILNNAVNVAQDSMAAQWQLMKNELKAVMLDERLVRPMKELVMYMREQGGLEDLAEGLSGLLRSFIDFWRGGGFTMLVNGAKMFLNIIKSLMPLMLALGKTILWVADSGMKLFPLIMITRLMKAGTVLNRMISSMMTYIMLRRMEAGMPMGAGRAWMYGRFVDPTYMMMARGGGAAPGSMIGRGTGRGAIRGMAARGPGLGAGVAAGGGIGLGGLLGLGAVAGILLGGYGLYKYGQGKQEEFIEDFYKGGSGGNSYNFYGDTYGMNGLANRVNEANTINYSRGRRTW